MIKIFVVIDDLITDENSWETHLASLLQGYVVIKYRLYSAGD